MGLSLHLAQTTTIQKHRCPLQKRVMDLVCIFMAAPLLIPVFTLTAILVRLKIGTPVLFKQERPGYRGHLFKIYKFRTMTDACDERGHLLPDGQRLTRFGSALRRSSLDELPELFNVIKGEMSLVGPRPLLIRYLPYYTDEEKARHEVLPGITGWAQVHGRNLIPWDERLALDIWYVTNWSFWLDLKILFVTFLKVVRREGVSADTAEVETDLDQERAEMGNP